jgi:transcriptional regulator with XRE-family HTH domain
MTMIRLSGSQLHAARVLVGLSRDALAERAGVCRHSIREWETSNHAIPGAMYGHLCRAAGYSRERGRGFGAATAMPAMEVWSTRAAVVPCAACRALSVRPLLSTT